ncbi:MAG: hypothetical protein A2283_01660 [Lentisphaerae bacterium RIFOXYA12_FULL_48_11]|nr:MAG: hypothetical protein A2283_01660 [Lentisphaerae bacterium RIFOXYA12_FULL_48_11]
MICLGDCTSETAPEAEMPEWEWICKYGKRKVWPGGFCDILLCRFEGTKKWWEEDAEESDWDNGQPEWWRIASGVDGVRSCNERNNC